jgi:hypothetical protein
VILSELGEQGGGCGQSQQSPRETMIGYDEPRIEVMINNQFQSSLDRFEKQRRTDVRTITMYNHANKKDPLNQTVDSDMH